ncbi:MAG: hypothetical protein C4589_05805 [Peptococcaceae bacterium]|nr:MAG: hypothetical protein C4589_05805 [Peptococcaceae bacterium]
MNYEHIFKKFASHSLIAEESGAYFLFSQVGNCFIETKAFLRSGKFICKGEIISVVSGIINIKYFLGERKR